MHENLFLPDDVLCMLTRSYLGFINHLEGVLLPCLPINGPDDHPERPRPYFLPNHVICQFVLLVPIRLWWFVSSSLRLIDLWLGIDREVGFSLDHQLTLMRG